MKNEIDITRSVPITNVTGVTPVTPTGEKAKWSRKIKCPRCGNHPLEIYNFVDSDWSYVCKVYVCDKCNCPNFFTREECDLVVSE